MSAGTEAQLQRQLGLPSAVLLGLGSIVGTGIFVSVLTAIDAAHEVTPLACVLAALLATANGLSSAQLAAAHPVSGGTYEYGYRLLSPSLGFSAGWMFLCAKSASAATAALGAAVYGLQLAGVEPTYALRVGIAVAVVALLTVLTLGGVKRSNVVNVVIVGFTLLALGVFIVAGVLSAKTPAIEVFAGSLRVRQQWPGMLEATALLFVAYTGYGRIATLGEEVHHPEKTIPRAIVLTLLIAMALYTMVTLVVVAHFVPSTFSLPEGVVTLASLMENAKVRWVVSLGAITAMLGVLLNLILGLSRVLLAMGRRGDMPAATARLNEARTTPTVAVVVMGAVVGGLTLLGSLKTAWSFSAFTVLVYYAITNLAALRLPREQRRYPRIVAVAGLLGCLFVAFWVTPGVWLSGLGILAVGFLWHLVRRKLAAER